MKEINRENVSLYLKEKLGIENPDSIFEKGNLNKEAVIALLKNFTGHDYDRELGAPFFNHPTDSNVRLTYREYPHLEGIRSLDEFIRDMRELIVESNKALLEYENRISKFRDRLGSLGERLGPNNDGPGHEADREPRVLMNISRANVARFLKNEFAIDDPETVFKEGKLKRKAIKATFLKFTGHQYHDEMETFFYKHAHPNDKDFVLAYGDYALEDYQSLNDMVQDMTYILATSRKKALYYGNRMGEVRREPSDRDQDYEQEQ